MSVTTQLIANQWQAGLGHTFQSVNPANNDVIWQANTATAEQVDGAVAAAREAFYSWADKTFAERLAIVKTFAETLKEHSEELAIAIAQETGKPLWETRTEAGAMVGKIAISEKAFLDPKIKATGTRRYAWIFPQDIEGKYIPQEAHYELSFYLPKGSYATVVVDMLRGS